MQLSKKYPRILIGFWGTLSNKNEIESFLIYPSLFLSIYNSKKSRCKLTKKEKTIVLFNHCIIRSFVPCPKTHNVEACVVGRFPPPPSPSFFLGGGGIELTGYANQSVKGEVVVQHPHGHTQH